MTDDQPVTPEQAGSDSGHAPGAHATIEDPTAGGMLCGARRSTAQIRAAVEAGEPNPWPWCRLRAGWATDHTGAGRCKLHFGATPNARKSAQLRLAELAVPALATMARLMTDTATPAAVRRQAASDILDRAGYPRKVGFDVESRREALVDRLVALAAGESDLDGDAEGVLVDPDPVDLDDESV